MPFLKIHENMKKIMLSVLLLSSHVIGIGQSTFPKFVLLEQFTNTWCPICAGANPSFYSTIQKYPQNVHHVSIHPPYPYDKCPLYLYNKAGNQERASYYKISGTPSVVMNGVNSKAEQSFTENELKSEISKNSPLLVSVTEKGTGDNRSVTVTIKSSGAISGDLRLIVLLAEKNLKFTSQNGEVDHYNVFRKYLTASTGTKITIINNNEQKFDFNYKDSSGWKPEEMYALAFVQNAGNNEVLNSGTKFDLTTPIGEDPKSNSFKLYPTITRDMISIESSANAKKYEVINLQGQVLMQGTFPNQSLSTLSVKNLSPGAYWIKIKVDAGVQMAKFIKQ